jgi:hypothetical protein
MSAGLFTAQARGKMSALGVEYQKTAREICAVLYNHRNGKRRVSAKEIAGEAKCSEEQVAECLNQDFNLKYLFNFIQPHPAV